MPDPENYHDCLVATYEELYSATVGASSATAAGVVELEDVSPKRVAAATGQGDPGAAKKRGSKTMASGKNRPKAKAKTKTKTKAKSKTGPRAKAASKKPTRAARNKANTTTAKARARQATATR
jgi:hypothetical protein